jgi:hypothetical protein
MYMLDVLRVGLGVGCGIYALNFAMIALRVWKNSQEDGVDVFHPSQLEHRHILRQ